jgi:hypothetical protein
MKLDWVAFSIEKYIRFQEYTTWNFGMKDVPVTSDIIRCIEK